MPRMKGAELITEYLIASEIPYVFGICGHGNVGMLDPLYQARDRIKLVSPRHEQVAAHMADAYFRVRHEPVATLTSCGPGSCNIVMPLQVRAVGFLGDARDHRQRADLAVQPHAVPGNQQALPGRLPQHRAAGGQAQLPADPGRHAAAGAAAGDDDDAVGPAGAGECRCARSTCSRKRTTSRCRRAAPPLNAQRSGASPEEISRRARHDPRSAQRPVIFIGHGVTLSEAARELTEFAQQACASR